MAWEIKKQVGLITSPFTVTTRAYFSNKQNDFSFKFCACVFVIGNYLEGSYSALVILYAFFRVVEYKIKLQQSSGTIGETSM